MTLGINVIKPTVIYTIEKPIFGCLQVFEDISLQKNSVYYTANEKLSNFKRYFLLVEPSNPKHQGKKSFPICKQSRKKLCC